MLLGRDVLRDVVAHFRVGSVNAEVRPNLFCRLARDLHASINLGALAPNPEPRRITSRPTEIRDVDGLSYKHLLKKIDLSKADRQRARFKAMLGFRSSGEAYVGR